MRKKVTGMIAVCILAAALTACGTKDEPAGGDALETPVVTEDTSKPEETPTETEAPETTETPEATETPETTETPEATETPEETKKPAETKEPEETKKPATDSSDKGKTEDKKTETAGDKKKPSKKPNKKPNKENENTKEEEITKKPEKEAVADANEAYEKAVDGIELSSMADISEDMLSDAYGIDSSILKSYVVKIPLMNVRADEIAVFQVKKKKDVATVKEGIKKRQAALEENWKYYLPDQYENVKNYQIAVEGNYVLFVISSEAATIVSNFKEAFEP